METRLLKSLEFEWEALLEGLREWQETAQGLIDAKRSAG